MPPDRGLELAKIYGVDALLMPIIEYVPPANGSPPPAPKHVTAAPRGPRQPKGARGSATPVATNFPNMPAPMGSGAHSPLPLGMMPPPMVMPPQPPPRAMRQVRQEYHPVYVDSQLSKVEQYDERAMSPAPSEGGSSASRTPSPLGSEIPSEYDGSAQQMYDHQPQSRKNKRTLEQAGLDDGMGGQVSGDGQPGGGPALYARMILDYFVSESAQIPGFLISPPADFDPNVVIDDDGHTALHWACAMGRIRIVKLLLTAGADIFRANAMGQTALMRSVMFTNNYDLRKFPELFELLHRSTINIDRNDRTVFHYVIDIALQKGKAHAARYYLEVILDRLKEYPREVADILNFQDEEGETALTLAARARSKNLVRTLLNHGADAKITNRDGKSAEDYILEDERFKNSHIPPAVDPAGVDAQYLHAQGSVIVDPQHQQIDAQTIDIAQQGIYQQMLPTGAGQPIVIPRQNGGYYPSGVLPQVLAVPAHLHTSETGQRISTQIVPQVHSQLEALAATFDAELEEREKDIAQAHALLANIQAEAVESQRMTGTLQVQAAQLEECQEKEAKLQGELKNKIGKRFRLGWEKYVRDEEDRQKGFVNIAKSEKNGGAPTVAVINGKNGSLPADIEALVAGLPANGSTALLEAVRSSTELLTQLKAHRRDLCDQFVKLQSEAGAGGNKVSEYRKLIALGCGVKPDEVDAAFVKTVLEQLDNGDEV